MPAKTTIQEYPLEKRKIVKKSIGSIIIYLILLALMIVLHALVEIPQLQTIFFIIDGLLILAILITPIYQYLYYKSYFYDVRPDFLIIRKGVIAPRETILNYKKLQDVYVDQDLFDRLFSLYDVHVSTATIMSGFEAHIDGVNQQNAAAIKDLILDKISKKQ